VRQNTGQYKFGEKNIGFMADDFKFCPHTPRSPPQNRKEATEQTPQMGGTKIAERKTGNTTHTWESKRRRWRMSSSQRDLGFTTHYFSFHVLLFSFTSLSGFSGFNANFLTW